MSVEFTIDSSNVMQVQIGMSVLHFLKESGVCWWYASSIGTRSLRRKHVKHICYHWVNEFKTLNRFLLLEFCVSQVLHVV